MALISVHVLVVKKISCQGRKNVITHNVMYNYNLDMRFTFVYSGWVGSANDSRVFENAIMSDKMVFLGWLKIGIYI